MAEQIELSSSPDAGPELEPTPQIVLDLTTVTLGEMVAIETASGRDFLALVRGSAGRRMVALFLHEWRSSGTAPSWLELSSRRPLGDGSST